MAIDRRTFLKHASAGALGLGVGCVLPRTAQAAGWGELPVGTTTWPTPVKVLEIFCYSGLSQWETFWLAEDAPNTKDWRNFETDVTELSWHCSANPVPTTESTLFGQDAAGTNVYWGPATKPLWRNDIFSRTRMIAVSHSQLAHALAIPLTLTGHRLGNPRSAGKGSVIQHRQMSLASSAIPYSYVIGPDDLGGFAFTIPAAASNGTHPGYAQPLVIRIGDPTFQSLLQRSQMTAESDHLIRTYQAMEADRLRYQGHDLVRSTNLAAYNSAVDSVQNAPALNALLNSVSLNVLSTAPCASAHAKAAAAGTSSPQLAPSPNKTETELDLATALLATGGARYVCVIDRGPDREPGGTPYDLHFDNDGAPAARILSNNVFNLCTLLAERIDANDPAKIHLDDTLIIIHSEFGRTPNRNSANLGRDHWPFGYAAVLIGGPIATRSIAGGIDASGFAFGPPAGATATSAYSPTDVHAAVLLAAGINPVEQENFGVADFSSLVATPTTPLQGGEDAVRVNLKTKILGL